MVCIVVPHAAVVECLVWSCLAAAERVEHLFFAHAMRINLWTPYRPHPFEPTHYNISRFCPDLGVLPGD